MRLSGGENFVEESVLARSAMRRIGWRLVPFLIVAYFISFLDRVNVGFAAIQMNKEIGLTPTMFGWGAGIFFLGYFLFEVPSNLALERFGARIWIARIMATWGLISCGMAFVSGPWSFVALRFLLGVAEAGFFPGVILYLTYWFPSRYRARIIGYFTIALPVSSFLGSPLSVGLLGLSGWGLAGWQWLFIVEGAAAILLALAVPVVLTNRPANARWLPAQERAWVEEALATEAHRNRRRAHLSIGRILSDTRVLLFAFVLFGSSASAYGLSIWTPQIIKAYGLTNLQTGLLNSIPYGIACLAMVWWGQRSDRMGERRWHLAVAFLVLATGLAGGTVLSGLAPVILALVVAASGVYMLKGPFWALATEALPPATAAVSIATISAVGNLGGFVGPFAIGAIRDMTGSFALSLVPMIALAVASGLLSLVLHPGSRADAVAAAGQ
jgi:ACS family tartrate transporter-like MFS transporter